MVRDRGLGEVEGADEVADADLGRGGEAIDDGDPGRVGKGLEPGGEGLAVGHVEGSRVRAAAERREYLEHLHRYLSIYHSSTSIDEGRIGMACDCSNGCDCGDGCC